MTKSRQLDIILIISLILVSLLSLLCLFLFRQDGKRASVEIDGQVVAVYSLSEDGRYSLGGGSNILVIEQGEAYIAEANCPDGTCMRAGRLSHVGQSAVCLPNRLTVRIIGENDGGGADLVS